jgi:hypothetical protein
LGPGELLLEELRLLAAEEPLEHEEGIRKKAEWQKLKSKRILHKTLSKELA